MPNITWRAVFRIGDGSLAIVIPKHWAAYHRIEAGDRLEVVTNGVLKVRPKRKEARTEGPKRSLS